jgi:hypothetical protein
MTQVFLLTEGTRQVENLHEEEKRHARTHANGEIRHMRRHTRRGCTEENV